MKNVMTKQFSYSAKQWEVLAEGSLYTMVEDVLPAVMTEEIIVTHLQSSGKCLLKKK